MKKITSAVADIMLMMAVVCVVGCNKPENKDDDVKVTTYTPQDIMQTTAKCGGDVIATQGLALNELGVCWSTSRNPTIDDSHLFTTNWREPYVCTITGLAPGTDYHVRAFALRGLEYYYGEDKSFTTKGNSGGGGGGYASHAWVDLGLPSGTLWATCNVGATIPEDYGDYFAWGETQPKEMYNWDTYHYCIGSSNTMTKYCNNPNYGYNGFTDNLTTLLPEDDAATVNWGSEWRMPTNDEWVELRQHTTMTWTTQNGVNGRLFTANNAISLFLPAAGQRLNGELYNDSDYGIYWSSSLYGDPPYQPYFAWTFGFGSVNLGFDRENRLNGFSVRPVRSSQ